MPKSSLKTRASRIPSAYLLDTRTEVESSGRPSLMPTSTSSIG